MGLKAHLLLLRPVLPQLFMEEGGGAVFTVPSLEASRVLGRLIVIEKSPSPVFKVILLLAYIVSFERERECVCKVHYVRL